MKIQPKPYRLTHKVRNQNYGVERRKDLTKMILKNGTPLPKTVEFKDIDAAFNEWVGSLNMSFNGKKLPIFKLFSNQRIGEYAQTWQHLDTTGNLLMNFFTVTRDNNPKQGQGQGGYFNIPGNRQYPMFIKSRIDENGEEVYEMYSMRQPFFVDFQYTLSLITDKYELLNEVNQTILDAFKALQCYISPNEHYMPLILDEIEDESEYNIDDRKYYAQSYKINLMGYIIRKQDFDVSIIPNKLVLRYMNGYIDESKKVKIDYNENCECCENSPSPYEHKKINIEVNFPTCKYKVDFVVDENFSITEILQHNTDKFTISILTNDGIKTITSTYIETPIKVENGDKITVEIERDKLRQNSKIIIIGLSDEIIDVTEKESMLDMPISEEDLIVEA